jgi:hypothetical protein
MSHTPEPKHQVADLDAEKKGVHVSNSVYFASEEFNALRKELYDHWREDPGSFNGKDLWYYSGLMVQNPPAFVEIMAIELHMPFLVFDSADEAGTCKKILNALRKRRGVSEL